MAKNWIMLTTITSMVAGIPFPTSPIHFLLFSITSPLRLLNVFSRDMIQTSNSTCLFAFAALAEIFDLSVRLHDKVVLLQ